jgi:hypothetical protein
MWKGKSINKREEEWRKTESLERRVEEILEDAMKERQR